MKLNADVDDLLDAFQLVRIVECENLEKWLSVKSEINEVEQSILEAKRLRLLQEGDGWNEEELKMHFLAFLFDVVDFNEAHKIKLFFERPLSAVIEDYELSVVCDAVLASPKGLGKMKEPYFFLQEFKKQKSLGDAEGQMLAAMLIAKAQNPKNKPVYGCWIQGRYWIFTILHDNNYCVSKSYDATQKEDLLQIVCILKELKAIILRGLVGQSVE